MYFLELALDTVRKTLKPGATFVAKMFQGSGSDQYLKELRKYFDEGADPQARGVAQGIARGVRGGEGVQGSVVRTLSRAVSQDSQQCARYAPRSCRRNQAPSFGCLK